MTDTTTGTSATAGRGGLAGRGRGEGRGGGRRAPGQGRGNRNATKPKAKVVTPKFKGQCKKELKGFTINHTSSRTVMGKDFNRLEQAAILAAGKISGHLASSLTTRTMCTLSAFRPTPHDPSKYTTVDSKGDDVIDNALKKARGITLGIKRPRG